MKKLLTIILTFAILGVVGVIIVSLAKKDAPIVVVKGNKEHKPLPIKLHKTNDTQCAMLIETEKNAAEVISPDGRTWFFDDPGCMVLWLKDKDFKDKATLWVKTLDTNKWVNAREAKYRIDYFHSAMHYGFAAIEKDNNKTIDFKEMSLRMLRGQTLANPKWRKKILGK